MPSVMSCEEKADLLYQELRAPTHKVGTRTQTAGLSLRVTNGNDRNGLLLYIWLASLCPMVV